MPKAFGAKNSGPDAGNNLPDCPVDPYEVAYLRGGSRELLKLRLFELMQKGGLIVIEKKRWYGTDRWLAAATDLGNREALPAADQRLLEFFGQPRTSKEVFKQTFPQELENACRRYRQELMQRQILAGSVAPEDPGKWWSNTVALFIVLAIFTMLASFFLKSGLPMLLLIVVMLIAGHYSEKFRYRLTDSGEQYLKGLQHQFQFLANFGNTALVGASPSEEVKAVAIFGLGILAKSPFDALAETLKGKTSQGRGDYGIENAGGCDGSEDSSCG